MHGEPTSEAFGDDLEEDADGEKSNLGRYVGNFHSSFSQGHLHLGVFFTLVADGGGCHGQRLSYPGGDDD